MEQLITLLQKIQPVWVLGIVIFFILVGFFLLAKILKEHTNYLKILDKNVEQQTKLIQHQALISRLTAKTKLIEETYHSLDILRKEIDLSRVEKKEPEKVLKETAEKIFLLSGKLADFMKQLKEV